ncbi:MAG: AAA family ATPase, partial [Candidatus Ranarchaeia archaeon]
MIIEEIELKGIRSWVKASFEFSEGFTVLLGPKGAGKSSVIIALIFALLGDRSPLSYPSIMREGANRSTVKLVLKSQGHLYTIKRNLIRRGGKISKEPGSLEFQMDGEVIARDKSEMVASEITAHLKQSKELISYTWYVRQESLKDLLNMQAGERKIKLDRLFQFDAFTRAFEQLRDVKNRWEERVRLLEKELAKYDIDKLQQSYNENVVKLDALRKDIVLQKKKVEKLQKRLNVAQKRVEEYDRLAKAYDAQKNKIEKLLREKSRDEAVYNNIASSEKNLEQDVHSRKKNLLEINNKLEDIWSQPLFLQLEVSDRSISQLEKIRRGLQKDIQHLSSMIAVARRRKREAEERENALAGQENCVYCGQPLSSSKAQEFRRHRIEEIRRLTREISVAEQDKAELEAKLAQVEANAREIRNLSIKLSTEEKEIEKLVAQQKDLYDKQKKYKAKLIRLNKRIEEEKGKLPEYDRAKETKLRQKAKKLQSSLYEEKLRLSELKQNSALLERDIDQASKKMESSAEIKRAYEKEVKQASWLSVIRRSFKDVLPKLRTNYIRLFQHSINNMYGRLNPSAPLIEIDTEYTPILRYGQYERKPESLSGGERTEVAIAYRIALGNTVSKAISGHPLELLILDE